MGRGSMVVHSVLLKGLPGRRLRMVIPNHFECDRQRCRVRVRLLVGPVGVRKTFTLDLG